MRAAVAEPGIPSRARTARRAGTASLRLQQQLLLEGRRVTSLVTSVTAARRAGLCPTCTKGVMMAILSDRGEDTTGWIKLACLCARVPGPESEIQGLYHSSWGNSQLCQSLHERSPFTFVRSVFHEECRPPDPPTPTEHARAGQAMPGRGRPSSACLWPKVLPGTRGQRAGPAGRAGRTHCSKGRTERRFACLSLSLFCLS